MLNESTYRSPKWLRKFLDFEIKTGSDISGEKGKKELLIEWDSVWDEIIYYDYDNFISFIEKEYRYELHKKFKRYYLFKSDVDAFKKHIRGDSSIFKKYSSFKKTREEKEKEKENNQNNQNKIKKELDDLYYDLQLDFYKNSYDDKVESRGGLFTYRFEDGHILTIQKNVIKYKGSTYTVGIIYQNKFVDLANYIVNNCRKRNGYENKSKNSGYKSNNDPKRDKYDKLLNLIKIREEQLKKTPNDSYLKNELDNYRRAVSRMKSQYKFENIFSYSDWNKIND